jgi:hypothetical protein
MEVRFWQQGKTFKFAKLRKKAAWRMEIKFINIIKLNQEITSIISPPHFLRSQNVRFRKQIFISYSITSEKTGDRRQKFSIHKHLKRKVKYICGKHSSKKYSIISEQAVNI